MKCIITEKIDEIGIELLRQIGEVQLAYGITRKKLLQVIKEFDVLIVRSDTPVDRELIDKGVNLKVIGMAGIGLNHIDTEYAKERNIQVFNVVNGSNDSVAEMTIGMMINIARKICKASQDTKNKIWNKTGYIGNQLKGKTLGLLAMGKIGTRVASLAQAIGMKIIVYDPYLDTKIAEQMNVELKSLNEILGEADFISIHAPLTKDTYHMIGEKELNLVKKGTYIINLGRGGIIVEDALYNALKNGQIAGAALDVLEVEPNYNSKLFTLDNVIITPHIGAGTAEAQQNIAESLANKILEYLSHEILLETT